MGKAKTPPNRKKARKGAGARAGARAPAASAGPGSFHYSVSLEELIRQQSVKPITDLNELAGMWPDDFDPDAFLEWLATERAERRKLAQEKGRR